MRKSHGQSASHRRSASSAPKSKSKLDRVRADSMVWLDGACGGDAHALKHRLDFHAWVEFEHYCFPIAAVEPVINKGW